MYLLARIAFQVVQMMQQLNVPPTSPTTPATPMPPMSPIPPMSPMPPMPEGGAMPEEGAATAPAAAEGFVRICQKCGQLSYFREGCCLNSQCESCLCLKNVHGLVVHVCFV